MGVFDKAFKTIESVTVKNADAYKESFAVEMLTQIARDTPVDTGAATAGWTLSANSPETSPNGLKDTTITATPTRQRAEKAARKAPAKSVLYIANGVQSVDDQGNIEGEGYIIKLEKGKSPQSRPGMMFGKNVAMAPAIAKQAAKSIGL